MTFRATRHDVATVVLAAGRSRRMGFPKSLVEVCGETFLGRILKTHRQAGLPVCVVLGEDAEPICARVDLFGALTLINPTPENGPLSSLRLALSRLGEASAVIVHPVDHPLVAPGAVQMLAARHRRCPDCILIPTHQGCKGHPTLFPGRFYRDLRECPLEEGARWVVRRYPASTLWLPTWDSGILYNLNTPEETARALARLPCRPLRVRAKITSRISRPDLSQLRSI